MTVLTGLSHYNLSTNGDYMNKATITLLALTAVLGMTACTEEKHVRDLPPGKYESMKKTTDASGTTTVQKSSTEVDVDEDGNKKAVVKSKTTKDPKGLFNKKTTSETKKVIEDENY